MKKLLVLFLLFNACSSYAMEHPVVQTEQFIQTIIEGTEEQALALLHQGADIHKGAPLVWATRRNKMNCARALIERGADVNQEREYGETPLYGAVQWADTAMVLFLFERGAHVIGESRMLEWNDSIRRNTIFDVARLHREKGTNKDLLALLEYQREKQSEYLAAREIPKEITLSEQMLGAISFGDEDKAIALLEEGADLDDLSKLAHAISLGRWRVAQRLIEKGADVDKGVSRLDTPLLAAVQEMHIPTVKLLLEKGAQLKGAFQIPEAHGFRNYTVFDIAQHAFNQGINREILPLLQAAQEARAGR